MSDSYQKTLSQEAACGDRPDCFHAAAAVGDDLVVQVGGAAGVVGDHLDALADLRLAGAAAEVDVAVLLGLAVGDRFRVVGEVAVAALAGRVVGERLRAAVEDRPVGGGTADDGGDTAHGPVVPGGGAGGDHAAVVVDVGAGAVLGDDRHLVDAEPAAGAAAGDDAGIETALL